MHMQKSSYHGKKICITGASAGIGLGFAERFAVEGADLVLVARRAELLEQHQIRLRQAGASSVEILVADLTLPTDLKNVVQALQKGVDIFVNNAGHGSFGHFVDLEASKEEHMLDLNVKAFLVLAQAAARVMKEQKSGVMVNLSSLAGFQPLPYMATYSATKAFDLFLSLALERELRPSGVQVLTVCPGPVATEFGGVARVPGTATGGHRDSVEDVVEECFQAIARGKGLVLPCPRTKWLKAGLFFLPLRIRIYIVERLLRGPLHISCGQNGQSTS
jgi:short-subunit dehydrogenase